MGAFGVMMMTSGSVVMPALEGTWIFAGTYTALAPIGRFQTLSRENGQSKGSRTPDPAAETPLEGAADPSPGASAAGEDVADPAFDNTASVRRGSEARIKRPAKRRTRRSGWPRASGDLSAAEGRMRTSRWVGVRSPRRLPS